MALVTRPSGPYSPVNAITNATKYQDDSAATSPKIAISSADVDGDMNKAFDELTNQSNRIDKLDAPVANTTEVVVAAADTFVFADASDSNAIKRDTIQGLIDLVTSPIKQIVYASPAPTGGSTTSTSYADLSGHTATITPTSGTSNILIVASLYLAAKSSSGQSGGRIKIVRGASDDVKEFGPAILTESSSVIGGTYTFVAVDAPSTTSSTTYKIQWKAETYGTFYSPNLGGPTYPTQTIALIEYQP